MMGIKSYQEKIFYNFSLSSKVPHDHLLRRLEEVLDLRFVRIWGTSLGITVLI